MLAKSLPYCNSTLPIEARAAWIVANLTLAEKIAQISPDFALGNACGDHTEGKPSIGLPQYYWLTESNTVLQSKCYYAPSSPDGPGACPTTFSGPMNMGSSFNRTSWYLKGEVLGTELRALNNLGWGFAGGNVQDRVGISGYGPNINIARDRASSSSARFAFAACALALLSRFALALAASSAACLSASLSSEKSPLAAASAAARFRKASL
jgi:hypothetical protein